MQPIDFKSLGLQPYGEVLALQRRLQSERQAGLIPDTLLTLEHPKVITRGRRDSGGDFLLSPELLQARGFAIEDAGRGGRLTYHGPGQLVAYFIFNLAERRLSIPNFVRQIQDCVISTLRDYGLESECQKENPGVWIGKKKIASLGLAVSKDVTMHGVALNLSTDLEDFKFIIPCGLKGYEMTSLAKEKGKAPGIREAEQVFWENARKTWCS